MMSAVASVLGFVAPATKIEKIWKQIKSMGASIVMMLTFIFAAIQKKPCVIIRPCLLLLTTARILSLAGMNQFFNTEGSIFGTRHRSAISSNENEWPSLYKLYGFFTDRTYIFFLTT